MKQLDIEAIQKMDPSRGIYLQVVKDATGEHLSITEPQGCLGKFMIWLGCSSASLSKVTKYIAENQGAFSYADCTIRNRLMPKIKSYTANRWFTNRVAEFALRILNPFYLNDLGNNWLIKTTQGQLKYFRDEDTAAYAVINSTSKTDEHRDLAKLFPHRKVSKEVVVGCSCEVLLALPATEYMAILDLMSGAQCLAILRHKSSNMNRKMALYAFNPEIGGAFAQVCKSLVNQSVDEGVVRATKLAFTRYQKYTSKAMQDFQNTAAYVELDRMRKTPSITLSNSKRQGDVRRWERVNRHYLVEKIQLPFTLDFLTCLNASFRAKGDSGLRTTAQEVFINGGTAMFHTLPGRDVRKEMNEYVMWLNTELDSCRKGEKNPIVVAALAGYLFVIIHPYQDGNGRTGRMLTDLILREFGLLPVAWGDKLSNLKKFNIQAVDKDSPNDRIRCVLEGLDEAYQIAGKIPS